MHSLVLTGAFDNAVAISSLLTAEHSTLTAAARKAGDLGKEEEDEQSAGCSTINQLLAHRTLPRREDGDGVEDGGALHP